MDLTGTYSHSQPLSNPLPGLSWNECAIISILLAMHSSFPEVPELETGTPGIRTQFLLILHLNHFPFPTAAPRERQGTPQSRLCPRITQHSNPGLNSLRFSLGFPASLSPKEDTGWRRVSPCSTWQVCWLNNRAAGSEWGRHL